MISQDWANLSHFDKENKKYINDGVHKNGIVFFGNSITQEWTNLSPEYFPGKPYINRGIGGQTTPQLLVRFRQDVVQLKPKSVIISAGTNDVAGNTGECTNNMILDNIKSMAEIALANDIQVMLCSILPVYDYSWKPGLEPAQRIIDLNEGIKNICKELRLTYVDYFSRMVDERNGLMDDYTYDGVHPDKNGYKVMESIIEESIKNLK
ncbi:SGNH/GDSL hydrolase family protein [bacterium]|nr:SGNH/GDSL hydrolase family protein [bacterium]